MNEIEQAYTASKVPARATAIIEYDPDAPCGSPAMSLPRHRRCVAIVRQTGDAVLVPARFSGCPAMLTGGACC